MLALWILAAHMVGDFLLQTRWQAEGKVGWTKKAVRLRWRHVNAYALPFLPIAAVYSDSYADALWFVGCLWVLHFMTDAQRFRRTPGEIIAVWWRRNMVAYGWKDPVVGPNPWTPLPILIDQALHIVQLAVLAAIFLGS